MRSRFPTICGRLLMRAVALGCIVWAVGASGQGTISFGTPGDGVRVYDVDGKTPLAGADFLAELYAAPPGGSLEPIGASITPFATGAAAGYFWVGDGCSSTGDVARAVNCGASRGMEG